MVIVALVAIFFLMVSLSAALDIETFINKIKKPKGIIIGLVCQFILLPFFSYIISIIFGLSITQQIGLIITGSCPGGALSNAICFIISADLSLSVAMTSASSDKSIHIYIL